MQEGRTGRATPQEHGFVLITALWLLVLGGALASLIMLRAVEQRRASNAEGAMLRQDLSAEAAIHDALFDLLVRGAQSRWAQLPARATTTLDGSRVDLSATSEATKIDLNSVDLTQLDALLQQQGIAPERRRPVVGRLQAMRAARQRIESEAQLGPLLADLDSEAALCPAARFTLYSGLSAPKQDGRLAAGEALRFIARPDGGAVLTMVVRLGDLRQPLHVLAFDRDACA